MLGAAAILPALALLRAGGPPEYRFVRPEPAAGIRRIAAGGRWCGVELPGGPLALGRAVERLEVLRAPRALVLVAGGVREDLGVHVLTADGRRLGRRLPGARLLEGFERPLLDEAGTLLALLDDEGDGVHLLVFDLQGPWLRLHFERRLERRPPRFDLAVLLDDPWVRVVLGRPGARAPGGAPAEQPGGEDPVFLHPAAAFPRCRPARLVLEPGASAVLALENPGRLPLPLSFAAGPDRGLLVEPASAVVPPRGRIELTLRAPPSGPAAGTLTAWGPTGRGEPFVLVPWRLRAARPADTTPPKLRADRIRLAFAPGGKARIRGLAGAVQDESAVAAVGAAGGARTTPAADGSFELVVPRPLDGRILLWAEDRAGNRCRPVLAGVLRDRSGPRWRPERIRLGPSFAGRVQIRGAPGAVRDETPPIVVRVEVAGRAVGGAVPVAADGSFRCTVPAKPGQRIRLLARDGAAPAHASPPLPLGRALPYIERTQDGAFLLHGPPGSLYTLTAGEGDEAERFHGRFNLAGLARWRPRGEAPVQLRLDCRDPETGLPLTCRAGRR